MASRFPWIALVGLVVLSPAIAAAQATPIVDTTPGSATNDGVINAGEYVASLPGNGTSGFGGAIGQGKLYVDSSTAGAISIGLKRGPANLNDYLVIYVDSATGGFADNTTLNDDADQGRRAISGYGGGGNRATLHFPEGFVPDYAITLYSAGSHLYRLAAGNDGTLVYKKALTLSALSGASSSAFEVSGLTVADLGTTAGAKVSFLATYINAGNAWRSNEGFPATIGLPGSNPGIPSNVTLAGWVELTTYQSPCGNSALDTGETCDDGNATGGDGCSAACQRETGWYCATVGAACATCTVCAAGTYEASGCTATANTTCDICHASCATCNAAGTAGCTLCNTGFWDSDTGGGVACTACSSCPAGKYPSAACTASADTQCSSCHSSCAACSGGSASQCTGCPSGSDLVGSACLVKGDTCANPILAGSAPVSVAGDTTPASGDYSFGAGKCPQETDGFGLNAKDLVWSFTPTVTGDYKISTTDGAVESLGWGLAFYVVTDCANVNTTCVVGSETNQKYEVRTVSLTAGTTYFVIVDGWGGGAAGAFTLAVKLVGCPAGYAGPTCAIPCAGGAANPCTGHGTCSQGPSGDGTCTCGSGYWGAACDRTAIVVTTNADEVSSDGDCSLREAIKAASANTAVDACPAGKPGVDRIVLAATTYKLPDNLPGDDHGDLDVAFDDLEIQGQGAGSTIIDGSKKTRILDVNGVNLTVRGVTLQKGDSGASNGAGFEVSSGLLLEDVEVALMSTNGDGGAIWAGAGATVTLRRCHVHDNDGSLGGAIAMIDPTAVLVVEDSTFAANLATAGGGAVYAMGATTFRNVTFAGNIATDGGAAYLDAGAGARRFESCTIAGNSAGTGGDGSAILSWVPAADLTIFGSLFSGNTGGTAECALLHKPATADYNLAASGSTCLLGTHSVGGSAALGALGVNGSGTPTRALGAGSLAIDKGSCTNSLGVVVAKDQRGVARPATGCDIGAYEVVCGDSDKAGAEGCDDGNGASSDGCSAPAPSSRATPARSRASRAPT